MLPLAGDMPQRRFPIVNAALIALNIAVFVFGLAATKALVRSGRLSTSGPMTGWGTT